VLRRVRSAADSLDAVFWAGRIRWTQANQLTDQLVTNRRPVAQPGGLTSGFAPYLHVVLWTVSGREIGAVREVAVYTGLRESLTRWRRRSRSASISGDSYVTYLLRYFQLMAGVRWLVVCGTFPLV